MSVRRQKKAKRAIRQNSNVFAMFDQKQIVELKEAFSLIDHDTDGFIDREDLKDMLASLGQSPTEEYIEDMISEAPGSINFTMFLTLMGEKLSGTDPEHEILQAFECFDEGSNVKQKAILSSGMVEAESSLENSYPNLQSKDLVLALSTAKNLKRFEVSAKNVEDVAHLSAVDMDGVEWATKTLECFQCFVKAVRHRADVPHFKVESLCNCPNVDLCRQFQRPVYEQLPTQKRLQEP
ncbi:hypothetical protein BGZ52_005111 [Haplosporangium bisporale]|nr:hypothetical protein BGZ52_005111 [Haplosporangium bisporale]